MLSSLKCNGFWKPHYRNCEVFSDYQQWLVNLPLLLSPAAPLGLTFLNSLAGDHLEEHGLLVLDFAQHAAQALDVFAHARSPAQHNGDLGLGHIDALVEHAR